MIDRGGVALALISHHFGWISGEDVAKEIRPLCQAFALKNAIEHNGKANEKIVFGMVMGEIDKILKEAEEGK